MNRTQELEDLAARAKDLTDQMHHINNLNRALSLQRQAILTKMHVLGMPQWEIAQTIGVSQGRIGQILWGGVPAITRKQTITPD